MYNRVIYKISQKPRNQLTTREKELMKKELAKYHNNNIPIYAYVKRNEVYFYILYDSKCIRGFNSYDDAYKQYLDLVSGIKTSENLIEVKKEIKKTNITLEDGFKALLEKHHKAYLKGDLKYSSYTKKESTIKLHIIPYFKNKPVVKITKGDIARFVDHVLYDELSYHHKKGEDKKLSPYMQKEVLMYFKMLYKYTKRWYDIETTIDVDNEVEMPTIKKARRQYSNSVGKIIEQDYDQNLKKILEKIVEIEGGIYNPIFAIQLMINCTGMRINEVIALKPNKLDYTNNTLLVDRSISWHPNKSKTRKSFEETSTKTDGERTILIPDVLVNYLKTYINRLKQLSIYSDDIYIFSRLSYARNDDYILHPFSLKTFDNHIREAYIKTNLLDKNDEDAKTIRNHVARHAFNTKLKNNHIEEYDRKEYIGHSNGTSVNEGYTHKSNKEERRIVRVIEKYILYLCKDIQEFNEI